MRTRKSFAFKSIRLALGGTLLALAGPLQANGHAKVNAHEYALLVARATECVPYRIARTSDKVTMIRVSSSDQRRLRCYL